MPDVGSTEWPRPLLVFDLDGTLIDTTAPGTRQTPPDFHWQHKEVRLRPRLAALLSTAAHRFDFAVWTAAPREYADAIVAGIRSTGATFPLQAIFTKDETEVSWSNGGVVVKELRKLAAYLDRPLWRMLIVDDTPTTYTRNVSNAVPVPTFPGRPSDDVLPELLAFLEAMPLDAPLDVRGWRLAARGTAPLVRPEPPRRLGSVTEDAGVAEVEEEDEPTAVAPASSDEGAERELMPPTPANLLSDGRYTHATCGMHPKLLAQLRPVAKEGPQLRALCERLARDATARLRGTSKVAVIVGPVLGSPACVVGDGKAEVIIWLLLDPLDIDSKQTTLCRGAVATRIMKHLYKWTGSATAPPHTELPAGIAEEE